MTYYWAVRLRETGEEQFVESEGPYAPYDGDFFEIAELPRAINPLAERWDWEAGEIVSLVTPQIARDVRWKAAQDYRELRRNAPLPVWGVFPNRAVVVKMDVESRLTIAGAVQMAGLMKAADLPFSFTFDDEAGQETSIDADQTIALGLGVAVFSGLCDNALRAVRKALDEVLGGGASATAIAAIDITAGYPGAPGAGDPPEQPET